MVEIIRTSKYGEIKVAQFDGRFYVFYHSEESHQVYSAIPKDQPAGGGQWCSNFSEEGIKYVASPLSRQNANRYFRKLTKEASDFYWWEWEE